MKVPLKWLQEFVDPDVAVNELAHRLTLAGLEVERIDSVGAEWDHVYVGVVREVSPHPNADRLVLADVEAGVHRLTVVTGAPNIAEGQTVALALAGAELIDGYSDSGKRRKLKPTKMRGVLSEGMVCSEKELGLSDEHEGILELEPGAPVGAPLAEFLGDTVLEFEITPNLVHDFSVYGIARETAAVFDEQMRIPDRYDRQIEMPPLDESLVTIEADDLCPRYEGVVLDGISIGPSPQWIARKLTLAGVRPINNIVDITNFVMLEYGQPLHAFDLNTLAEERIVVRTASAGETIETLDHEQRTLSPDMLVIADARKPIAIAGVMGGAETEVQDSTSRLLLEAANFDMKSVRKTAREIRLRTEASARFERGLDPNLVEPAMRAAVRLILDSCPGARAISFDDVYPEPVEPTQLEMPFARIRQVLGVEYPVDRVSDVLERLAFEPEIQGTSDDRKITVTIPTYRHDVSIPDDIVEEVARIIGYDTLPSTLPEGKSVPVQRGETFLLQRRLRQLLTGSGLTEMMSYVALSESILEPFVCAGTGTLGLLPESKASSVLRLQNPLQENRPILRPTLAPSMLETLAVNLKHSSSVRLFEFSRLFVPRTDSDLPSEIEALGFVMAGERDPFSRFQTPGELDFFDAKGVVEVVLARSGIEPMTFEPFSHPALHPGRCSEVVSGETILGVFGELHPDIAAQFGVDDLRVCLGEFNLDTILTRRFTDETAVDAPRYLPVRQDFAVVVDLSTPAYAVAATLREAGRPLVTGVELFDVYEGESIENGRKSLAFRMTFTAPDRNLTDDDLVKVRKRIERSLKKRVDGTLRS